MISMKRMFVYLLVILSINVSAFAESGLDLQIKLGNSEIDTVGGKAYLLLNLIASDTVIENRSPVNLALVIDRSGSMSGDKIKYVRRAAISAINMLDEQLDIVSTIIYDDEIDVIYPAQRVDKKKLKSLIEERVTDRGSTALHGGLMRGVEEALKKKDKNNVTRVLLLSDGLANVGITDPEFIAVDSRKSYEKGLSITTLGVGSDYNENLMVAIAKNGHGNYYFIEKPDQIEEIFSKEFASLLSVVAKDIKIKLIPLNRTKIEQAIGYELMDKKIEANNIFSGAKSRFLFEIYVPRGNRDSKLDIFKIEVSYFDILQNKQVTLSKTVSITYNPNNKLSPLADKEIYEIFTDLHLSDNLEKITKYLDKGENKKAVALSKQQIELLKTANKILHSAKITDDIKKLENQQKQIEALGTRHYQESEEGRIMKKAAQQQYFDKQSK